MCFLDDHFLPESRTCNTHMDPAWPLRCHSAAVPPEAPSTAEIRTWSWWNWVNRNKKLGKHFPFLNMVVCQQSTMFASCCWWSSSFSPHGRVWSLLSSQLAHCTVTSIWSCCEESFGSRIILMNLMPLYFHFQKTKTDKTLLSALWHVCVCMFVWFGSDFTGLHQRSAFRKVPVLSLFRSLSCAARHTCPFDVCVFCTHSTYRGAYCDTWRNNLFYYTVLK